MSLDRKDVLRIARILERIVKILERIVDALEQKPLYSYDNIFPEKAGELERDTREQEKIDISIGYPPCTCTAHGISWNCPIHNR